MATGICTVFNNYKHADDLLSHSVLLKHYTDYLYSTTLNAATINKPGYPAVTINNKITSKLLYVTIFYNFAGS
jgi:hypothetical protein